jgi:hypothetical protein
MLLKDASIEVEGAPYHIGTRVLRDIGWRSRRTTELARRLSAAGFIFLGKTNVPVLSAGITTEPPAFGPTRNPWTTRARLAARAAARRRRRRACRDRAGRRRRFAALSGGVLRRGAQASRGLVLSELARFAGRMGVGGVRAKARCATWRRALMRLGCAARCIMPTP